MKTYFSCVETGLLGSSKIRFFVRTNENPYSVIDFGNDFFFGLEAKVGEKVSRLKTPSLHGGYDVDAPDADLLWVDGIEVDGKEILHISEFYYESEGFVFVFNLRDGRTIYIQADKNTNRLDADYNTYKPVIYRLDNGDTFTEQEEAIFLDMVALNKPVQDWIADLDDAAAE